MNLLGSALYDPSVAVSKATSALLALTAFDTSNLRLAITVPAHGKVRFKMRCAITGATTSPTILLGVLNGATVLGRVSPTYENATANVATQSFVCDAEFTVTGLTPGAMNVDAAYAVQVLVASTNIKYGGPNTNAGANAWGGLLFEAWDPQPVPTAAAGAANGLLIAGANAATTFATLTSTGAMTVNGVSDVAQTGDSFAVVKSGGTGDNVAIKTKTDFLPSATAGAAGGVFIAGANAATSVTTAFTANVTGNVTGNLSGSVGSVTGAVGSVSGAVGSVTGAVGSVTGNVGGNVVGSVASVTTDVGITQAGADKVWASAARTLTSFGTLVADVATAVWGAATRVLTAGTNIVLAKGTGVTGFNDIAATAIVSAGAITTSSGKVSGVILTDTLTTYTGNTPQTGDNFARIGAAGAGLTAIGDSRMANLDATVTSRLAAVSYTAPSNSTIASIDARLPASPADETLVIAATNAIMSNIGTAGAGLTNIGDTRMANLNATVGSRSTYAGGAVASVTAPVTLTVAYDAAKTAAQPSDVAAVQTLATAIKAVTDALTFTTGVLDANVKTMNGATVQGAGTVLDPWRAA